MTQPDKLDFGRLTQGQHAIGRVWVRNGGGGELDPVVKTSAAWLRARLDGEDVIVALDTTTPGVHSGQLTISSQGGDTTIPITARVDPGREKPVNSDSDATQDSSQPPHGVRTLRRETLDGIVAIFFFTAVVILMVSGQILRVLVPYKSEGPSVPYGGLFATLMVAFVSGAIVETVFFPRTDSDKPVLTLTAGIAGALLGTLLATNVLGLATLNETFHPAIWLASVLGVTIIFTLYLGGYFILRAIRGRN
jgi:hypothetical protein